VMGSAGGTATSVLSGSQCVRFLLTDPLDHVRPVVSSHSLRIGVQISRHQLLKGEAWLPSARARSGQPHGPGRDGSAGGCSTSLDTRPGVTRAVVLRRIGHLGFLVVLLVARLLILHLVLSCSGCFRLGVHIGVVNRLGSGSASKIDSAGASGSNIGSGSGSGSGAVNTGPGSGSGVVAEVAGAVAQRLWAGSEPEAALPALPRPRTESSRMEARMSSMMVLVDLGTHNNDHSHQLICVAFIGTLVRP